MTPEQRAFWDRFCAATGHAGEPFDIDQFGDSESLGDELLQLVLIGRKQATCALARWYEQPGARFPEPGDLSLILDGRGHPACVIRTTKVEIKPVREADAEFAWIEGEGDRSFKYWWDGHIAYWKREANREGFEFSENLPACFEQFELVWVPESR